MAKIFFEDEISLSTQGTVHRTWARVGKRPRCPTFGKKQGVKVFGAVSNQHQFRFRVQTVYFNQETFTDFLSYFRYHIDGFVIMIVDGAKYHRGPLVQEFLWKHRNSFEMEYLPAYSPELNPQEDVWKIFRKEHTHNRCFYDTEDLLAATRSGFRSLQRSNVLDGVYRECQNYFLQ